MAPERSKVSPEVVMENARKQVSGLEAAIAAMTASGMDENSPEVTTLRGSLVKANRNAQEAPIAVQVKGAQEFDDRTMDLAYMCVKPQMRLMCVTKCVYVCVTAESATQWSSLRSLTFARFARTFFDSLNLNSCLKSILV